MSKRKNNRTGTGSFSRHTIAKRTRHGAPRLKKSVVETGYISSISTELKYRSALTVYNRHVRTVCRKPNHCHATFDDACNYLQLRAAQVQQKQLNIDRAVIELVSGYTLPKVKSLIDEDLQPRAFSEIQYQTLLEEANTELKPCIRIAWESGLRAHEFYTLDLLANQPESTDRPWSDYRFEGILTEFVEYTVVGKGGLVRQVAISKEMSEWLESRRRPTPVVDREIRYESKYDILGGHRLSHEFWELSIFIFDWSVGFHGLRHSYARRRMDELTGELFSWDQAKQIVSCELGHFRPDVTDTYLR